MVIARKLFARWMGVFILTILTTGCGGLEPLFSGTGCPSDEWTVIGNMHFGQSALSVMFGDAVTGVAGDLSGKIYYTEDGGTTWTGTIKAGASRAALEILEGNSGIWYIGVGGDLEHSVDRGHTWKSAGLFPWTGHVEYISFSDELDGWGMTTEQPDFYATADGGKTWNAIPLPEGMGRPAALHLRTPRDGYILDTAGNLFISADGGANWEMRSIGLADGDRIPTLNHSAAVRFSNARYGVIAVMTIGGGTGRTRALRTSDGGATWIEEPLPVPMGMFHLSRDGVYLTHMDLYDNGKITLLCSANSLNP
jgi:photosystem II stability/assembly factor-like uncharacterized protein